MANHGAANDTNDSCLILELPVELIEMIVLYGDTPSLLHLRATCRDLEAKTRSMVIDCCFTDPMFMLADRTSMNYLLAVSRHPIFSRTVVSITLVLRELCPAKDMQRRMRVLPEYSRMNPREQRNALRERQRVHQQLKDDEKLFRKEQEAVLIEVLDNFMYIERLPAISTVGDQHGDNRHTVLSGLARLQRILQHPQPLQSTLTRLPKEASNTVLKAVVKAEYPPVALQLGAGAHYSGDPCDGAVDLTNVCLPTTSLMPTFLIQLSLTIDFGGRQIYSDENFDDEWDKDWDQAENNRLNLMAVLTLATDLVNLTLEARWAGEPWARDRLLQATLSTRTMEDGPALMKLQCLRLNNITISDCAEFMDWVKERRATLRVVDISGSLAYNIARRQSDLNIDVWDTIWAPEKRHMKVLIIGPDPGFARGKYCKLYQRDKREQYWRPARSYRYGGGHQNDDCDCPRKEGWQGCPTNILGPDDAALHQSGKNCT